METSEKNLEMYMVHTVIKAFRVLKAMAASKEPMSIAEIARAAGIFKSVCYRLLVTMMHEGVVAQSSDGSFRLGLGLAQLGSAALDRNELSAVASDIIEGLMRATGESVYLNVEAGMERVCIAKADSPHTIRHYIALGVALPLYAGAGGKILLAACTRERFDDFMDNVKPSLPGTGKPINREELWEELNGIRVNNLAWSFMERTDDAASVGSPVRDSRGGVVASLVIAGPAIRFQAENRERFGMLVRQAAVELSRMLGYIPGKTPETWGQGTLA